MSLYSPYSSPYTSKPNPRTGTYANFYAQAPQPMASPLGRPVQQPFTPANASFAPKSAAPIGFSPQNQAPFLPTQQGIQTAAATTNAAQDWFTPKSLMIGGLALGSGVLLGASPLFRSEQLPCLKRFIPERLKSIAAAGETAEEKVTESVAKQTAEQSTASETASKAAAATAHSTPAKAVDASPASASQNAQAGNPAETNSTAWNRKKIALGVAGATALLVGGFALSRGGYSVPLPAIEPLWNTARNSLWSAKEGVFNWFKSAAPGVSQATVAEKMTSLSSFQSAKPTLYDLLFPQQICKAAAEPFASFIPKAPSLNRFPFNPVKLADVVQKPLQAVAGTPQTVRNMIPQLDVSKLQSWFRRWSVLNHPDKGGSQSVYQMVSGQVSDYINILRTQAQPLTASLKPNPVTLGQLGPLPTSHPFRGLLPQVNLFGGAQGFAQRWLNGLKVAGQNLTERLH